MATVAQEMREMRLHRGLSREKLAAKLNVSLSTIVNWEKGTTEPHGNNLVAVERWMKE